MTEGETLYRNILLEPDNDHHRLVYADWLEDQGDSDRAEYIRAAVELASDDAPHCPYGIDRSGDCGWVQAEMGEPYYPCRLHELTRRSAELLRAHRTEWFGSALAQSVWNAGVWLADSIRWDRGFPAGIACNAEQFMQHRAELFSTHPITSVRLADRHPMAAREGFFVWTNWRLSRSATPCAIGETLFALVVEHPKRIVRESVFLPSRLDIIARFDSAEDAEAALSDACVQLGRNAARRLIGLPEMTRATF